MMEYAPMRIAFREEGEFWNAYLAHKDTITGAIWLGSIRMAAIQDENRKAKFMALMRDVLAFMVKDVPGFAMVFFDHPEPAPEHERAGNA